MKNKTYIALGICAGLLVVNTEIFTPDFQQAKSAGATNGKYAEPSHGQHFCQHLQYHPTNEKHFRETVQSPFQLQFFCKKKKMVPLCFWQKLHRKLLQTEKQLNFV